MANHADRFVQRVGKVFCAGHGDWNRAALDFRRPAGHVAEYVSGGRDIDDAREKERLAVVECFQFSEFVAVPLDQIGELPKQAGALGRQYFWPWSRFKCLAGRGYRLIDVGSIAFRHVRQDIAGRGIVGFESLAGSRFDPVAADQHFSRPAQEFLDGFVQFNGSGRRGHDSPWDHLVVRLKSSPARAN